MGTSDSAKPHFRRAHQADAESVVSLVEAYYALDGIPYEERSIRRGLQELLTDSPFGGVWLIEHEQAIAGYFVLTFGFDLEFGGRVGMLTDLYLAPGYRRRGLGSRALQFIETTLLGWGIESLELQAELGNVKALAFYEKLGMTRHTRVPLSKRLLKQ